MKVTTFSEGGGLLPNRRCLSLSLPPALTLSPSLSSSRPSRALHRRRRSKLFEIVLVASSAQSGLVAVTEAAKAFHFDILDSSPYERKIEKW